MAAKADFINESVIRHDAHKMVHVPAPWLPQHNDTDEERTAAAKLRQHFRRMGFERLGRTPYYALPTAIETPSADELLEPNG